MFGINWLLRKVRTKREELPRTRAYLIQRYVGSKQYGEPVVLTAWSARGAADSWLHSSLQGPESKLTSIRVIHRLGDYGSAHLCSLELKNSMLELTYCTCEGCNLMGTLKRGWPSVHVYK